MAPKHDMKFYAHHFFSTLRILYVKMATSEEGVGGLHIRSWKTTDELLGAKSVHLSDSKLRI